MRRALAKLGDTSGQSFVELALLLPVLVLLTLGLIDLARAIHAHNSIVNMSREGANLATRSNLMSSDRDHGSQMLMNAMAGTAQGLDMKANGMMYLTEIQSIGGIPCIVSGPTPWAERSGGPPSTVNPTSLATILRNITLRDRDRVSIFEVFYSYQSMFTARQVRDGGHLLDVGYHPQLHTVAIFPGGLR